ncbi:hypothetical protein Hanom_Chr14g01288991 [Helianthus anomalus]
MVDFPSFAISFATAITALANCPPFPSVISMLCMAVPKGISVEVDSSFFINQNPFPQFIKRNLLANFYVFLVTYRVN